MAKVLVIDDEELARRLLMRTLDDLGHTSVSASNMASALERAQSEQPDLITLDIELADESGFAILEQLRRIEAIAGVPIIVISGRPAAAGNRERAIAGGAVAYVEKTHGLGPVVAAIEAALEPPE